MTRMLTAILTSGGAITALAFGGGGCSSGTTDAPADTATMDLTNAPPPMSFDAPGPAGAMPSAPMPELPPPAPEPRTHAIARGDTLYSLAVKYYGSGNAKNVQKIRDANPGLVETRMTIGKTLTIPE